MKQRYAGKVEFGWKIAQMPVEAYPVSKAQAEWFYRRTEEFHALQVTQRPAFLIENAIGDRAVFSGIVRLEPLAAAIDALLADQAAYDSYKAHFGGPPEK